MVVKQSMLLFVCDFILNDNCFIMQLELNISVIECIHYSDAKYCIWELVHS